MGSHGLNCFEHTVHPPRHISDAFWNAFECNVSDAFWVRLGPRLPSVESGPRLPSVESGPRLPSEKSGQVAAAARVAAAGALAPAGAYGVNAGMARARQSRARAILGVAKAPAGAKAPAAATIAAAAATWPDFSDGNLGPDSTEGPGGPFWIKNDQHLYL